MICYQMKSETEQFNIRINTNVLERLDKLAFEFNKRSKATVAAEIVEQYIDFWEQTEDAKRKVYLEQHNVVQTRKSDLKKANMTEVDNLNSESVKDVKLKKTG